MKLIKFLLIFLSFLPLFSFGQGMTDSQVLELIQREKQIGSSNAQITTKLIQRGVNIEQIRRIRNNFASQLSRSGLSVQADREIDRMRRSNYGQETTDRNGRLEGKTQWMTDKDVVFGRNGSIRPERDSVNMNDILRDIEFSKEISTHKIFGHDIFNNEALSFEPNMNIATPTNYVIGPGDQVIIDIYGGSQKTLNLQVSPDGTVTIPNYGPVQISGLTVAAANSKVRSLLGVRYSSSDIRLTMGQTRTILVNVMGEVQTPGTYHLSAFSSVFHALYMAGGISDIGTLRNVKVFRDGRHVTTVDIYDYILNGRLAGNIRLQEGDVIVVGPYDCLVAVDGNVKRPMLYEMRPNESVATLLKYAGGFTGDAYRSSVRLVRQSGERFSVHTVDEFDFASFKLLDGDSVNVGAILDRYDNTVEIRGAVFRPGLFQLGQDVTTVKGLVERAGGVTEDAFTTHAVMHRLRDDRSLEMLSVDVAGILSGTSVDIPLRNEDVLFIPTKSDLQQKRTLTIEGEVLSPGTYDYAVNTTIEDLIMLAGGLTDAASVSKVDVSRRLIDPKSMKATSEIAETFSFSLKDGFVIDGVPGFTLEPYDIVQVRKSPGFQVQRSVQIDGEVTFPGRYTLAKKTQRLSDLVTLAGGITGDAYIKGARLERRMSSEERARLDMTIRSAQQSQADRDSVSMEKLITSDVYTVGIHLEEALKHPGSNADVILKEGDRLVIPIYDGTVKISGEVMYPNTVSYESGKKYKWYVRQAGGFGERAKKSKAYVVYPNGTMAMAKHDAKITPGCEIVIPSKHKKENINATQWISIGTGAASIASMIATIIYMTTR